MDEIDLSQRGLINSLKGKFLEMAVEVSMLKFNREQLPGSWFGRQGALFAASRTASAGSLRKALPVCLFLHLYKYNRITLPTILFMLSV